MLSFLEKLLVAALIGGVIGLEREHTKHQTLVGVRTFSLISLFGMLLSELAGGYSPWAILVGLVGILALTLSFYYFRATHFKNAIGMTTILVMPLTYVLGVLVSVGYVLEAIAATVLMAYVLVERGAVHRLVEHISRREIMDGLLFALLAFVLYPLVPVEPVRVLGLQVNVQLFFTTIILVSAISFLSHVVLKFVHKKAVLVASFFGGLVSALATVMLFSREKHWNFQAFKLSFASSASGSLLRDLILLAGLSPLLFSSSLALFLLPLASFACLTWYYSSKANLRKMQFVFNRPIRLSFVFEFAAILFAITLLLGYVASHESPFLLYLSLFVGGAINSASAIASVASFFAGGKMSLEGAVASLALALMGSAVAKLAVMLNHPEPKYRLQVLFLVVFSVAVTLAAFQISKLHGF